MDISTLSPSNPHAHFENIQDLVPHLRRTEIVRQDHAVKMSLNDAFKVTPSWSLARLSKMVGNSINSSKNEKNCHCWESLRSASFLFPCIIKKLTMKLIIRNWRIEVLWLDYVLCWSGKYPDDHWLIYIQRRSNSGRNLNAFVQCAKLLGDLLSFS